MDTNPAATHNLADLGLIDAVEVAQMLGVKAVTLRNWGSQKIGPAYTPVHGNRIAYPLAELRRWLESRTVQPSTAPTLVNQQSRRGGRRSGRVLGASHV